MSWHCDTCDYDLCRDCYSPRNETKEEDDGPNCPKKHGLTEFEPEWDEVCCVICGEKKRKGDMMYGCNECDYNVCAGCKEGVVRLARCDKGHILQKIERYKAKREARQIQSNQFTELSHDHANTRIQILPRQGNECDKGHVLVYKNNGYGGLFTCNQCGGHISQSMSWHCDTCDYDLCRDCYSFHNGTKEEDDGPNCPKKHGLTEFEPESDGVRCDICGQKKRKGDMMHGCRECDYDVCAGCKEGVVRLARCDKGHILKHK
eukprot:209512_1